MKTFLFTLVVLFSIEGFSQTPTLSFDGDDFVNVGPNVGNGFRTLECWFQLGINVDQSLPDYITLIGREESDFNINEFNLAFQKNTVINSGTLRFSIALSSGDERSIYSNNNSWEADRWYHIAVCIDPIDGMTMFIDGVKQNSTHPYTASPAVTNDNTIIGNWGGNFSRYFIGQIDDVHFAAEPLYSSDFSPFCPDRPVEPSTLGLYHFNEGSGSTTADNSGNQSSGTLIGATWASSLICENVGINDLDYFNSISVYPNPVGTHLYIQVDGFDSSYNLMITDLSGQLIKEEVVTKSNWLVDMNEFKEGLYVMVLQNEYGRTVYKIIKD